MSTSQAFTLFGLQGRIYAQNAAGKLVDLGALNKQGAAWNFRLDADGVTGTPAPSIEAALAEIPANIDFLFLDGQFTALTDLRDEVVIPRETPYTVVQLPVPASPVPLGNADTPHIF